MKKKIRSIVVMNKTFNWRVDERIWPNCYIKIWIPNKKQVPWIECEFKAPFTITPLHIKNIITHFFNQFPDGCKKVGTIKTTLEH